MADRGNDFRDRTDRTDRGGHRERSEGKQNRRLPLLESEWSARYWAIRGLAALACGVAIGIAAAGATRSLQMPVEWLEIAGPVLAVAVTWFCMVMFRRALGVDPSVDEADAQRYRTRLLWVGPQALLEFLIERGRRRR